MPAIIWNLSMAEILVVSGLAVLVFGSRLPQVAGQLFRHVSSLRRHMEDLRRETGFDREIRDIQRTVEEAAREVTIEPTRDAEAREKADDDQSSTSSPPS